MEIGESLQEIQKRIVQACQRAKRNPADIRLILVTKNVPADKMRQAYDRGFRDFGENRVQEFLEKKALLPRDIRWHFVGHLQTNKVHKMVGAVELIHSLDRIHLAEEIQKQAEKKSLAVDALVEINTSGEATKSGFSPEGLDFNRFRAYDRIRIQGLMTIGPFPLTQPSPRKRGEGKGEGLGTDADPNETQIRMCFRMLRNLRDKFKKDFPEIKHLSMGMSSDFETAIEEGATMIRLGTAVFGERK